MLKHGPSGMELTALHSVDGGATWDDENNGIVGQSLTAFEFRDGVGYGTTVNRMQISSMLKFTAD